jgi:hypothetical protein
LEGNYSNCPFIPDTVDERLADEYIPLEQFIFHPDYQKKWNESFNTEGEIIIEIISQNEILISYRINDITIKSRIYRGKFINNYFEISTRRKIIGFPLTYFILNIDKLSLGISKEGYLIAASRRYRFGSLFIIFKGNHHSPPLSYFKKKQ